MHQGKDVIGEAGRVGVVLLDPQVGLVVQQAVEHIGGIADADIHHAGAERRVLVGDMGIEQPSRLATVLRVACTFPRKVPRYDKFSLFIISLVF